MADISKKKQKETKLKKTIMPCMAMWILPLNLRIHPYFLITNEFSTVTRVQL